MRVLVAIDHHFVRSPSGEVYVGPPTGVVSYNFWSQYLRVFEEVLVLARVKKDTRVEQEAPRADGPGVVFHDLPDYLGPWQYLRSLPVLRAGVRQAVRCSHAFILRVPGAIGQLAWRNLRRQRKPFALEVIADPWDVYSPGAVPSPVRPIARRSWSNALRRMCQEAPAVCYVTRDALQKRYPPGPHTHATYVSDVSLSEGLLSSDALQDRFNRLACCFLADSSTHRLAIGFLGSLTQPYKAPDVLLRAAALCRRGGLDFEVLIAGDGKYKPIMEALARELMVNDRVRFLGALPSGKPVEDFLDRIDLFVLPSRQEGLPRALVEAMSRGCPCIGSTVGGIPELLAEEDLVPPGDPSRLADKLREVLSDAQRMERMGLRNWNRAREYLPDALEARRTAFYRRVREQAQRPLAVPGRLSLTGSETDCG